MKPCSSHRKKITLLAANALDAARERALRAHLTTCAGCRGYFNAMAKVTEGLTFAKMESDIEASAVFHQRLLGRLRREKPVSFAEAIRDRILAMLSNSRVALPVAGVAAVVLLVWSVNTQRPLVPVVSPNVVHSVAPSAPARDLLPSIANYSMVAKQSLDKLDELLTRQADQNPSPAPAYTVSGLTRALAAD